MCFGMKKTGKSGNTAAEREREMNAGKELYFSVLPEQDGFRVDLFLQKAVPEYTRSFLRKVLTRVKSLSTVSQFPKALK